MFLHVRDAVAHLIDVQWTLDPESTGKRPALGRTFEAFQIGVHIRPPTRHPSVQVGHEGHTHHDHPNQVTLWCPLPATHTGAQRRTPGVYPSHAAQAAAGGGESGPPGPLSGRISIRQPVIRAASRAFWPSRPIAKDSW